MKQPHGWLGSDATNVLVEHVLQLHARMHPNQRRCPATSAHSVAINASQKNSVTKANGPEELAPNRRERLQDRLSGFLGAL